MMADNDELRARIRELEGENELLRDANRRLNARYDRAFHGSNAAATRHAGQMDYMRRKVDGLGELVRDMWEHVPKANRLQWPELAERMKALGIEVES